MGCAVLLMGCGPNVVGGIDSSNLVPPPPPPPAGESETAETTAEVVLRVTNDRLEAVYRLDGTSDCREGWIDVEGGYTFGGYEWPICGQSEHGDWCAPTRVTTWQPGETLEHVWPAGGWYLTDGGNDTCWEFSPAAPGTHQVEVCTGSGYQIDPLMVQIQPEWASYDCIDDPGHVDCELLGEQCSVFEFEYDGVSDNVVIEVKLSDFGAP